jgi:hypothetical protein
LHISLSLTELFFLEVVERRGINAWWWSIFHTVSAFNNAGFGLFSDNMVPLQKEPGKRGERREKKGEKRERKREKEDRWKRNQATRRRTEVEKGNRDREWREEKRNGTKGKTKAEKKRGKRRLI